jgi:hypothetical protein
MLNRVYAFYDFNYDDFNEYFNLTFDKSKLRQGGTYAESINYQDVLKIIEGDIQRYEMELHYRNPEYVDNFSELKRVLINNINIYLNAIGNPHQYVYNNTQKPPMPLRRPVIRQETQKTSWSWPWQR